MNGFVIDSEIKIEDLGITVTGAYVTTNKHIYQFQGSSGIGIPMNVINDPAKPISLSSKMYIYARSDITGLRPLKEEWVTFQVEEVPSNPLLTWYTMIKALKFPAADITDLA